MLVAEAGDEIDAEVEAVDVVVEVENIGLYGAGVAGAYGGTGADVADAAVTLPEDLHFDGIDPVGRDYLQRFVEFHVGRGKAHCPAELVTGDYYPEEGIAVTQHPGSLLNFSGGDGVADLG